MIYYRLRVRNKPDDADLFILSSVPDDDNPYLTEPPNGDGQSIDPLTGAPTMGSYTFRFADASLAANTRVFTQYLADAYARQQLLGLRAYGETSTDGSSWDSLIPGYILRTSLPSAIEGEIAVGDTRRREVSKELFKEASTEFGRVTCVIGGPVRLGFGPIIEDYGGWKMEVTQINSSPGYVQIKILEGFDPRKDPENLFSPANDVPQAVADYTNDWARPYFEESTAWLGASTPIQGWFPRLRVRLEDRQDVGDVYIVKPLSEPEATTGPWWAPYGTSAHDLTRSGESSLWLPLEDENGVEWVDDNGIIVGDEFNVFVYALPISEENPLHYYGHPVDLWESVKKELGYVAGVDYDDSNLADLKATVGDDVRVALRITKPYKAPEFERDVIFGPFRLSERIDDGKLQLFSISLTSNPSPSTVITVDDLREDGDGQPLGRIWDVDEGTVVTAITIKQQIIRRWTTDEKDQPAIDSLITSPAPTDTLENSDDDIPAGMVNEVVIGNLPGMIVRHEADPDDVRPIPYSELLSSRGVEIFNTFGRGAIEGEAYCLPGFEERVGEEFIADFIHRPVASVSQSPVSQRGGERRVFITQRTETTEGPIVRFIDSGIEIGGGGDTGVGGGSEEETDPTAVTPDAPLAFGGSASASANWPDSYPQWRTLIQWEGHPPSDSTFVFLAEELLNPGVFSHLLSFVANGWTVRCRIRYSDGVDVSSFSSYSNEVTITVGSPPATPTDVPTDLVATSPVANEAHAEWTNTNAVLQIRINWQGTPDPDGVLRTYANVAGGTRLLAATTDEDDQATGSAVWARFRAQYVNSAGVAGPYSEWSEPVEITT
jgi:hypothetical protein